MQNNDQFVERLEKTATAMMWILAGITLGFAGIILWATLSTW